MQSYTLQKTKQTDQQIKQGNQMSVYINQYIKYTLLRVQHIFVLLLR